MRGTFRSYRPRPDTRNQQQAQPATQVQETPQPLTTNAPPDFQFGHIASPAIASFPFIPSAAWGEENAFGNSHYPSFNKALALADRIGLKKTMQNIKRLEIESGPLYNGPSDPRPHKKRAGSPWNNLGVMKKRPNSPHPTHDDETVSLGWSEDEFDVFMEESVDAALNAEASGSGTTHRYVGGFSMSNITNTTHIVTESIINHNAHSALVTCEIESFPTTCLSEQDNQRIASWIIDSGASQHFTYNINDFIEYMPGTVKTANSKAQIIGKGMVVLEVQDRQIRIGPVYLVPDLKMRLLSLGMFLKARLSTRGNAQEISLYKGHQNFLTFLPVRDDHTIYAITAMVCTANTIEHETIYAMDFETMHCRLAHPSGEVLKKAGKYVKDFPNIEIPTDHICPGCTQGKMTNKTFPSSERRATQPFELIHSDLKSFPIESYHKFKYTIIFYDDYTSRVWTTNLKTKDAALPATKHFLAMVETQFQGTVRGWMSDTGGEYTSKAFTQMLHEKGIKILQSIPHTHQQNGRAERII